MEVEDLFTDLADGKKLLKLLEIISGEKLGKPNHGKMRVHKIENVNKSLAFLHTKVRLFLSFTFCYFTLYHNYYYYLTFVKMWILEIKQTSNYKHLKKL